MKYLDDKTVIKCFVAQLKKTGMPNLRIDRWPDDENRASPDIDAMAGRFAIEHTSIDTVENQRRNSAWFMKIVEGLEQEVNLPYYLKVILPWQAIEKGQDWAGIRNSLRDWVINFSSSLAEGTHKINDIAGLPFEFTAIRDEDFGPALRFARFAPQDDSLPRRLYELLTSKIEKLIPYKKKGHIIILIVESNDIALMNESILINGINQGFPEGIPSCVDQIWYADITLPKELLFRNITDYLTIESTGSDLAVSAVS